MYSLLNLIITFAVYLADEDVNKTSAQRRGSTIALPHSVIKQCHLQSTMISSVFSKEANIAHAQLRVQCSNLNGHLCNIFAR